MVDDKMVTWVAVASGVTSSCRAFGRRGRVGAGSVLTLLPHHNTRPVQHQIQNKSGPRPKRWCLPGLLCTRRYRHCARDGKAKKVDVCKRQFPVDSFPLGGPRMCLAARSWACGVDCHGLGESWGASFSGICWPVCDVPATSLSGDHCLTMAHHSASGIDTSPRRKPSGFNCKWFTEKYKKWHTSSRSHGKLSATEPLIWHLELTEVECYGVQEKDGGLKKRGLQNRWGKFPVAVSRLLPAG
jgi:hypothetical protein